MCYIFYMGMIREPGIDICDGTEMTCNLLMQALRLDRLVYPDEYQLEKDVAISYLKKHPEIYVFAMANNQLLGYLNISCIDEQCFALIAQGQSNDLCIKETNLLTASPAKKNKLYFSSIVVSPEHRHLGIATAMLEAFANKLLAQCASGIVYSEIIADAISEHGARLCESLGMQKLIYSSHKSIVYGCQFGCEPDKLSFPAFIKKMKGKQSYV